MSSFQTAGSLPRLGPERALGLGAFDAGSSDFVTEAAATSVDGGGGTQELAPNAWLLVYWMGRYYEERGLVGP